MKQPPADGTNCFNGMPKRAAGIGGKFIFHPEIFGKENSLFVVILQQGLPVPQVEVFKYNPAGNYE